MRLQTSLHRSGALGALTQKHERAETRFCVS